VLGGHTLALALPFLVLAEEHVEDAWGAGRDEGTGKDGVLVSIDSEVSIGRSIGSNNIVG
jgi:hypothetical protein